MPFYAVARGRSIGVFTNWNECNLNVAGYPGAKFKKFQTVRDAERFIQTHADPLVALDMAAPRQSTGSSVSHPNRLFDLTGAHSSRSGVEPIELDIAKIKAANNPELNEALKRIESLKRQLEEVKSENEKAGGSSICVIDLCSSPVKKPYENGFVWIGKYKFLVDVGGFVQVYINGCFDSDGGPSAGFGVYFGDDHELNMSRAASGRILHNCADIQAATECIRMAKGNGVQKLQIHTDSEFLINAVTKWMGRWKQNGWRTVEGDPVRNRQNFMRLNELMETSMVIKWNLVVDFALGNVKAIEMAEKAADEQRQVQDVDVGQLVYDFLFEDHYDDGYDYDADSYGGEDSSFIDDSDVESGSNNTYSTAEENDE